MFLECEDGLLPGWLNTKLGFFDFFFHLPFPCFHSMFFFFLLNSDIDMLTDREQRWVSVSEMAVHGSYGNIILVPCTLFSGQLFFSYEAELGRLNVKHIYWPACRHALHLGAHAEQWILFVFWILARALHPTSKSMGSNHWVGITFPSKGF